MADNLVRFDLNEAAVAHFVSWAGPVGRSFERLLKESVFRVKGRANKRTGAMIAGMHYKKGTWSRGLQGDVGANVPYTRWVDQGTKPHKIVAKNAPYLTFYWPKVGRVVHFKSVNHPGNKPYRFLERGVQAAMRMWERGG